MPVYYPYRKEVYHEGLNKYRVVIAPTEYELKRKVDALTAQWDDQWARKVAKEQKISDVEEALAHADKVTRQAEETQHSLDCILRRNSTPVELNFDELKDTSAFSDPYPTCEPFKCVPLKPDRSDSKYNPRPFLHIAFKEKAGCLQCLKSKSL